MKKTWSTKVKTNQVKPSANERKKVVSVACQSQTSAKKVKIESTLESVAKNKGRRIN